MYTIKVKRLNRGGNLHREYYRLQAPGRRRQDLSRLSVGEHVSIGRSWEAHFSYVFV